MATDTAFANPFFRANATPVDEIRRLPEYWITRDLRRDGRLDERIDVWTSRPYREVQDDGDYRVTWFSTVEGDVDSWVGYVHSGDLRANNIPVPDDDRMCIHVGKKASTP